MSQAPANRLHRASDALYKHREALQDHLFAHTKYCTESSHHDLRVRFNLECALDGRKNCR